VATSLARTFPGVTYTFTERDVSLYALAVGCGPSEGRFVYDGDPDFSPLPTFPCVLPYHGVISDVPLHEMVPNFSPVSQVARRSL
jgi:multifunctional beta-oxidation protein